MRGLEDTATSPDTGLKILTIAALCIDPPEGNEHSLRNSASRDQANVHVKKEAPPPDDASRPSTTTTTTGSAIPVAAAATVGISDFAPRRPDGALKAHVCPSQMGRRRLRAMGICPTCRTEPAAAGHIQCDDCRADRTLYQSGRRQRARTAGLCMNCCFKPRERSGGRVYSLCKRCRHTYRKSLRARRAAKRARYTGNGGDLPPRDHPDFAGEGAGRGIPGEEEVHPPGRIAVSDLLNEDVAQPPGNITLADLLYQERAHFPERAHLRERAYPPGGTIAIADLLNPMPMTKYVTETIVIGGRLVEVIVLD